MSSELPALQNIPPPGDKKIAHAIRRAFNPRNVITSVDFTAIEYRLWEAHLRAQANESKIKNAGSTGVC